MKALEHIIQQSFLISAYQFELTYDFPPAVYEFPSGEPPRDFSIIQRHGGTILLRAGHQYGLNRKNKDGTTVWRCAVSKKTQRRCYGFLKINGYRVVYERPHTCVPDFEGNAIAIKVDECRRMVENSNVSIQKAYDDVFGHMKDSALASKIPTFKSLKTALYNARHRINKSKPFVFPNDDNSREREQQITSDPKQKPEEVKNSILSIDHSTDQVKIPQTEKIKEEEIHYPVQIKKEFYTTPIND